MTKDENIKEATLTARLLAGAEKAFDNAQQLYREAKILGDAKANARSLCLHQIPLEECAKVDSLGAWLTSIVLGFEVDQKKVFGALARHASKNKTNSYMLEVSEPEGKAIAAGDLEIAREVFKRQQDDFHKKSNEAKNSSLYVDWMDGRFLSPSERITEEMLLEACKLNERFLGFAGVNLRAMRNLVANSAQLREPMLDFVRNAEKLRSDGSDGLPEN